jgi:hypothetical protein
MQNLATGRRGPPNSDGPQFGEGTTVPLLQGAARNLNNSIAIGALIQGKYATDS